MDLIFYRPKAHLIRAFLSLLSFSEPFSFFLTNRKLQQNRRSTHLDTAFGVAPLRAVLSNVDGLAVVAAGNGLVGLHPHHVPTAHAMHAISLVVVALGLGSRSRGLEVVELRQIAEHVERVEIHQHVVRRVDEVHRIDDAVVGRRGRRRRMHHVRGQRALYVLLAEVQRLHEVGHHGGRGWRRGWPACRLVGPAVDAAAKA